MVVDCFVKVTRWRPRGSLSESKKRSLGHIIPLYIGVSGREGLPSRKLLSGNPECLMRLSA